MIPTHQSPLLLPANEHKQLVVIDFEYASPNVRGLEFANHFVCIPISQSFFKTCIYPLITGKHGALTQKNLPSRPNGVTTIMTKKPPGAATLKTTPSQRNKPASYAHTSHTGTTPRALSQHALKPLEYQ